MTSTTTAAEVFPPGDYLRDELEERGWTGTEFAEIIGRPVQAVSEILNGKKEVTAETAIAFAEALGTSPELWLNLQMNYKLHQARRATHGGLTPIERRSRLRGLVPLSKVTRRGWLRDTKDLDQLEELVREFLDVANLDDRPSFVHAAKRSNSSQPLQTEQVAWLARVRQIARNKPTDEAFDLAGTRDLAARLPKLTAAGTSALTQVPAWFAQHGVVVVFVEGLPGGKLDGAVTSLSDGGPVIGLTARGDRFDIVLFTLLHELAHLTLGHITPQTQTMVDTDVVGDQVDSIEREANDQAKAWLFPDDFEPEAVSAKDLERIAARYGVHRSVIIGQIQRHTGNWGWQRSRIPKVRADLSEAGLLA